MGFWSLIQYLQKLYFGGGNFRSFRLTVECEKEYNIPMELFLVDRVAFTIFGMPVYWYGIIITSAIVLDFFLLGYFCKKFGYDRDMPFDLVIFAVVLGIVGARLFSVTFEPNLDITDFFKFRYGGMSIVGALMGGIIGVGLYSLIKKTNFFQVTDMLAPLVLLAQGIGRWGNFFNGEVYGKVVTDASLHWLPFAVNIGGVWHHALFFYESVLDILGFVALLFLFFKFRKKKGIATGAYLIYYGIIRFCLEPLRDNEFILRLGDIAISRFMSGVMVLAGLAIVLTVIIKDKKQSKNQAMQSQN